MDSLHIKITDSTPEIYLDKKGNKFEISGRSLPEEAMAFYQPVKEWIKNYTQEPNTETEFIFKLEYINSASVRALNDILSILESLYLRGFNVVIKWKYSHEDNEIKETGEEFAEIYKLPFQQEGYFDSSINH